jgi:hypothetical protein
MPKLTLRDMFAVVTVRYRLRTLMIAMAILPPLVMGAWKIGRDVRRQRPVCSPGLRQIGIALHNYYNATSDGTKLPEN